MQENPFDGMWCEWGVGVVLDPPFSLYFEKPAYLVFMIGRFTSSALLLKAQLLSASEVPAVTKTLSDAAPFRSGCYGSSLCLLALSCQNFKKKKLKNICWEFEKKLDRAQKL